MKNKHFIMFNARPHPYPLPRGEGIAVGRFNFCESFARRWPVSICRIGENSHVEPLNPQRPILPGRGNPFSLSPGERAGVRAGFIHSYVVLSVHGEGQGEGGRHI
jgi:hypothetical protein